MDHKLEGHITSRRQFLKATAGLAAGCLCFPLALKAAQGPELAVVTGAPAAATRTALSLLGGMSRFIKKGQRVVIKPNMSFAKTPEVGATTHPEVVSALAEECIAAGAREVIVVDHTLQQAELCLDRTGIRDACRNLKDVHVLAVRERKFFREVAVPRGTALERVDVLRDLLEGAALINVPAAKSHSATGVSLGLKGLMGLIWDRGSFHYRFDLEEGIVDLATVIRPVLTVLDATRALTTGGPGGPGDVVRPNMVVAGVDPVAVDAYGVGIAPWYGRGFRAEEVRHIKLAHQRGLGAIAVDRMRVIKAKA